MLVDSARRLVALLSMGLGLIAPALQAGEEYPFVFPQGVSGRVSFNWPESAHRGWAPLFLDVRNAFM